jgi:hypothetical protein
METGSRRAAVVFVLAVLTGPGVPGVCLAQQDGQGEYMESGPELVEEFEYNFERVHDKGVYARASAGLGWVSTQLTQGASGETSGAQVRERAGVGLIHGAHVGGLVAGQLALHLSHWGQVAPERGFLSAGGGVTFYFAEDANAFVSVVGGASTLYDASGGVDVFSQWGLGGELELGMGWWVAAHSSMGVSLVGGGTAFDLDGDQVAGSGWYAGVRMTLAVN